jgi:hypothetical protein
MSRIDALTGLFALVWSRISRIVMNPCMTHRNLGFGNRLSETCEMANMSMIAQFSGDVVNTTLTLRSNRS